MKQANIAQFLLPVILIPLAIVVILKILAEGGNQLGNSYGLLIALGGLFGFLAPRVGLLFFIVFQFYIDFLKRIMIFGEAISFQDLMISLGMGPIIIVMACTASFLSCVTGKVPFFNWRDLVFFCFCIGVSFLGLFLGQGGGETGSTAEVGKAVMGTSMLGMTAYAVYIILRTREDAHKILKYLVFGALPMAAYTYYQVFVGISAWEEKYIRTGMSMTLYNFYLLDGIDDMRPFSTLNTHTSLGAVSAVLAMICLLVMTRTKTLLGATRERRILYGLLTLLFLGSCFLSRNKTTYLLPILSLIAFWSFRGGFRTLIFYGSGFSAFVWIVANSEWLYKKVLDWSVLLLNYELGRSIGSIGTYQDRIRSLSALADFNNWTPFGLEEWSRPFVHDQLTEILVKIGYVPLLGLFVIAVVVTFWWHRRCLRLAEPNERNLALTLTSLIVALGICGLAYGNLLFVAPVNSIFGLLLGVSMAIIFRDDAAMGKAGLELEVLAPVNSGKQA